MTILGKVMVFIILIVSVAGLGMSIWVAIDYRDWKGEVEALDKEIRARNEAMQREEHALRDLLTEINLGARTMPFDVETQLGDPGKTPKRVRDAREDNKKLALENQRKLDEANALQVRLQTAIDLVKKARDETEEAEREQLRLREEITPDPQKEPNRQPFKVMIDEQKVNQKRSQDESLRYKVGVKQDPGTYPGEINELVSLAQLRKRNAELKRRLAELKGAAATTSARQ